MKFEIYKLWHFLGLFALLLSLGGSALHMIAGGTRDFPHRRLLALVHGIGLLLIIVTGFGMLAKLSLTRPLPSWAIAKILIWFTLGVMPALLYRKVANPKILTILIWVLAGIAGWLALTKIF